MSASEITRAALIANGGVENDSTGFSEALTFAYHFAEASSPSIHAFASTGLMIGTPDPAMLFPKGLTFLPYAVLRNTSAHPLSVTARVNYENSGVHDITLPPIQLAPYQTTGLPLADMVTSGVLKGFNGSINLMFSAQSHMGDLFGCGATLNNAELEDIIEGEASSRVPTPVYNVNQNGAAVQHWGQEWRVGTCVTGAGPRVETDTLQKYVDHAAYNGVVTPAP